MRSNAKLNPVLVEQKEAPSVRFLRMDDLAERLCYRGETPERTAYQWARRSGLPMYWRGRHRLVREDDVIEVLATGACVSGQARFAREGQVKGTR